MKEDVQMPTVFPPTSKSGWPWSEIQGTSVPIMGRFPKITIVTPSYNQGAFLEETIRSVLLQEYPDLEYIIVDGGSTDKTSAILKKYEKFIDCLVVEPDEGQSDAIAKGFDRAQGDILAWLNSDDLYLPSTLWRVGRYFMKNSRVAFANGDVVRIDAGSRNIDWLAIPKFNGWITANTGLHCSPQPGCFWRRAHYERSGGVDRSLHMAMDLDLFIRLSRLGQVGRIQGPPLAAYRVHADAKSSRFLKMAAHEDGIVLERYKTHNSRFISLLARIAWGLWCKPARMRKVLCELIGKLRAINNYLGCN